MYIVKQLVVTLVVLALAGAVWLHFDAAPGRYLLAENSPLPVGLRGVVASLSPADDAPPVEATPRRGKADLAPLVVVDAAVADVTRDRLQAIGTGEAERSVAVYPDASGIVTSVNFRAGDEVAAGDVLATLQDATERLAVDRARIALAAAQEQVQRYEALSSSSAITAVQLDEVRRAAENAVLDLRAAEIALERRNIVAPIAGRVGLTLIDVGALVGNQSLIATIDDRRRLKVVFNTPEAFVPEIAVGHPVTATPTARTGRVYQGAISAMDSRIDEASRTLRTEALIDNASDDLRPGMSFTVELGFEGDQYVSVLPLAIQWERSGSYVWVVEEGQTVAKAPVQIIERNVERVLVAAQNLQPGDAVVTEGAQQLREGLAVRIFNPDATEAPEEMPALPEDGVPSVEADPAETGAAGSGTRSRAERSEDGAGNGEEASSPADVRLARRADEAVAGELR